MRRLNVILLRAIVIVLLLLAPALAAANPPGAFYFTAMLAPKESLTNTTGQPNVVYLRWGTIEAELPPNLDSFVIERNGAVEATIPAAPMDANTIEGLYAPLDQARRKAEVIAWLDRENTSKTIDENNFDTEIEGKLLGDPQANALWLQFGSRLDFNIALAQRRGYRDDSAPVGTVTYELIATFSDATPDTRIGLIDVDTTAASLVPPADDLEQVSLARCDAPETGKDQASVALNWSIPQEQAEEFRNALLIAGFDVYRQATCTETDPPAPLDLRNLASSSPTDAAGNVLIPGLVRVNDQPVVVSGGRPGDREERYKGFNSPYSQFSETTEQVLSAGLRPGQKCAYYVVARDFTGNYGVTQARLVTIPDPLKPARPWVIETLTDNVTAPPELDITFDHVNVDNYYQDHQRGRTYCNLDTARFERELRYVPEGQSCDTGTQRRVKLDIVGYNIYRFLEPNQARAFQDSDGDGYGDIDERDPHPLNGFDPAYDGITDIGSACDPDVKVGTYFRVDPEVEARPYTIPADATTLVNRNGRLVVEFSDPVPANLQEEQYWYRVAAVHADDTRSELSEPVRGLFHDLSRPARNDVDCDYGELECLLRTELLSTGTEPFAEDSTSGRPARWVRIACPAAGGQVVLGLDEVDTRAGPVYGSSLPDATCQEIASACTGQLTNISFLDAQGQVLSEQTFSNGLPGCPLPGIRLEEDCTTRTVSAIDRPNSSARGPLGLECPPTNDCYRIFRDVGGRTYPLATLCPDDLPVCFEGFLVNNGGMAQVAQCPGGFNTEIGLPNLGGEGICLSIGRVNENNISSSKLRLPCIRTFQPTPGPPQVLEIAFEAGTDNGSVSWLPPEQPVLGTLVNFFRKDGPDPPNTTVFFPHPDQRARDGPLTRAISLAPPQNDGEPEWEEDWCFRARSIGRAEPGEEQDATSEWAGPLCGVRTPLGEEFPPLLPWPKIPAPAEGPALQALYLKQDGLPVVHLVDAPTCFSFTQQCVDPDTEACFPELDQVVTGFGCPGFCDQLRDALSGQVDFVAYRQERNGAGVASEFYQVSPEVPMAWCRSVLPDSDVLEDPVLKYSFFAGEPPPWNLPSMMFLDRVPHIVGYDYRYQFVYFDGRGEITGYRTSNWITAVEP